MNLKMFVAARWPLVGRAVLVACAIAGGSGGCTDAARRSSSTSATRPSSKPPLASWVDRDTGHTVHRLTPEPGSSGMYFNLNAYTPDGREMIYSAPDGIHLLNLAKKGTRLVVPAPAKAIAVGGRTATVYYIQSEEKALYAADLATGARRKIAALPPRGNLATINADETLAAGTYIEGDAGKDYGADRKLPPGMTGPLVQPLNKAQMMEERLAARLPLVLFTLDLKTGELRTLFHSTDWVNHLLFSPVDPTLLMYCHEGPWHKVDRIWTIRADGTQNRLIHKRTMAMEIAGHEFWGLDGKTIWYDLQRPKGEDFFVAGYKIETGERTWYHLQRDEWSVHFNVTADERLFCGDGGDKGQVARAADGQWIELFRPEKTDVNGENAKDFVQPGVFRSERLVNMKKHNYKLEPNVRFSPDHKQVIFTANLTGDSYVYAVDVEK